MKRLIILALVLLSGCGGGGGGSSASVAAQGQPEADYLPVVQVSLTRAAFAKAGSDEELKPAP